MKVLITNPPWLFNKYILFGRRSGVRAGSRWPFSMAARNPTYKPYPVFMGYAVSFLKSKSIDVEFYDAIALGHNYKTFFNEVDRISPKIVIQETSCPTFDIDLKIARALHNKGYQVCLVGPQATAVAEKIITLPFVDYVLKGAYEYSALEMINTQREGIYDYHFAELDNLPYPYRDKRIINRYRDYNCLKKLAFPQLWVYASRGCVFHCDFCLWVHAMFENKLSLRGPDNVVSEIDQMLRIYNVKHIYFDDDCWNVGPKERLIVIADGLKKIGLPWTINARLDLSTKEMFRYFVDRGCVGFRLGVESLSQRLLDISRKNITVKDIIEKINFLKTLDVDLYLLFIHYLPGEEAIDRIEQKRAIEKLGIRYQNPPCIPFPGTAYYKKICKTGFDLDKEIPYSEFDGGGIGKRLLNIVKKHSQKIEENE